MRFALLLFSLTLANAQILRNETFEIKQTANTFSITEHGTTIAGATLRNTGSTRIVPATDKTLGAGRALEVKYPNGDTDSILLFPHLPFVLFRSTIHNGSAETSVTEKIRAVQFSVDPQGRKILGTGGLSDPGKAPGSYMWTAIADPQTRKGLVAGWLTSDRGSGVVLTELKNSKLHLDAQIDYGKLRIKPNQTETLETFAIGSFDDAAWDSKPGPTPSPRSIR